MPRLITGIVQVAVFGVLTGVLLAPIAHASAIVIDGTFTGLSSKTTDGVTFNASGGTFTYVSKCAGCPAGLGISGGPNGDEIDPTEILTILLSTPSTINQLVLGYLYPAGQFGIATDNNNEGAALTFNIGTTITFTATGPATGSLTGSGTWSNTSPGQNGFGGAWTLNNPFGATLVDRIDIKVSPSTAACDPAGPNPQITSACGDFTINGLDLTASAIPEPGVLGLMAAGLAGFAALRRLRR